ncbi:MAG TPA: Hpt domain-containing protein [Stellaceae bacterium]|nr:Hpt domain-containing protein [Stellaceae bacterium]
MSDDDNDMDEVMAGLRQYFVTTLNDHVAAIREAWRGLREGADRTAREAAADELLRRAHRLAGNGRMVGFAEISDAAGLLEETLRAAIDGAGLRTLSPAPAALVARLLEACDAARKADGA